MKLSKNKEIERTVVNHVSSRPNIEAVDNAGEECLERLRDLADTDKEELDESDQSVSKEYWVKYYLENHGEKIGIDIKGNLDKEVSGERGDYRVIHDNKEKILEVEKDVKHFIRHGHSTKGSAGWDNPGSIDMIFATTDEKNKRSEIDITVIVDSEKEYVEGVPSFSQFYKKVKGINDLKSILYIHLLSSVLYEITNGIITESELHKNHSEMDDFSFKMNKRYSSAMFNVMSRYVKHKVDDALFGQDESIKSSESFIDLKERIVESTKSESRDGNWECPLCEQYMTEVGSDKFTYDIDYDNMTEGQIAEQMIVRGGNVHGQPNGEIFEEGVHGETIKVEYCFDCFVIASKATNEKDAMFLSNKTVSNQEDRRSEDER